MALKDWKTDKNFKGLFINRKTNFALSLTYAPRGIAEKPYIVNIMKEGFTEDIKYFKTNTEASKFAKIYMRSH